MPNRIVRDGILTSERVDKLGPIAEVFYRRLMSVADDYGRFTAHPGLLRASCYPLRVDKVREADISRLLAEVQGAGLVVLYVVSGKNYLELVDFRQQVRAKFSKYPSPADVQQMISDATHMQSNAHLGEDGGVFVDVCEDEEDSSVVPAKRKSLTLFDQDGVIEFPVAGNPLETTWWLTQRKIDEYRGSFPGVDVLGEARKALQWVRDNQKKTAKGMPSYLNRWFSKAQDNARSVTKNGNQNAFSKQDGPKVLPLD